MTTPIEASISQWRQFWLKTTQNHKTKQKNKKSKRNRNKKQKRLKNQKNIRHTSTYQQLNLHGENLSVKDDDRWGDNIETKHHEVLRIGAQNVHGLSQYESGFKNRQLSTTMDEFKLDVFLISELNLYWRNVGQFDSWAIRMKNIKGTRKSIISYNTNEKQDATLQFGGTAIIVRGDLVHRVIETGKDWRNLGRWVWIKIQGKHGRITRIVSGYRPCVSNESGSVYEQHRRYLSEQEDIRDPITVFDDDLSALIDIWKTQDEEIILGLDCNDDVRNCKLVKLLQDINVVETITSIHGRSGPATQQTNTTRKPIDGIWTTDDRYPTRAGYLTFGEGVTSDHRLVWTDIPIFSFYGISTPKTKKRPARRLRSDDPRLVLKYTTAVHSYFMHVDLYRQLDELYKYEEWNDELEKEYNRILKLSNRIKQMAEKTLKKLRMGEVEWSPIIQALRNKIDLYLCVIKRKKGGRVCRKLLCRKEKKAGIYDTAKLSLEEAVRAFKDTFNLYKTAKKEDKELRDKFMEQLCESRATNNNTNKESEMKKMKNIANQRRVARHINRTRAKKQRTATLKIFKNNPEGGVIECFSKLEVEDACIKENYSRFTQNADTPFLQPPLSHDIGFLAETDKANDILQGTYTPPEDTDQFTKLLIQELKMPLCIKDSSPLSDQITPEDNAIAWRKQKENISSNGLHFGHHKSNATFPPLNAFDAKLRTIPYKYGFAPNSWREITDVEILKKAGVFEVELMRTIQLLDSQFNMNNKKLGRDLMKKAEHHGLIAKEQAGSRKSHQAVLAALNKRLTMDLLRQKKQPGAIVSNDAKSCYDRVSHNVAILAMRRLGAPQGAVTSMFRTFQKAIHKVRTAYGDSTLTYSSAENHVPLQGIAQGNGCAPTGWVCISTPLINALRAAGYGALLLSALTVSIIAFVCYAFVDDTDLVHTSRGNHFRGTGLIPEVQQALNYWEGVLRATGGAIVPKKTFWVLFEFYWRKNKWQLATSDDIPGDLYVHDAHQTRTKLRRSKVDVGEETLGIFMSADGSEREEVTKLRKKSVEFADWIKSAHLRPEEAHYALKSIFSKTIEYPMAAICVNRRDWDHIMAPAISAGLTQMGICSKFPRKVVFGPWQYQGLDLVDPYYWQYFTHVRTILQEGMKQSLTGQLIRSTIEQFRLETGYTGRLTEIPDEVINITTDRIWIKETIKFMKSVNMQLTDPVDDFTTPRAHDMAIMQGFYEAGYRGHTLYILNICRLKCHALTLTDITTGEGTAIRETSWRGEEDLIQTFERDWPRSPPVLPKDWIRVWQQALLQTFGLRQQGLSMRLSKPLGDWKGEENQYWIMRHKMNIIYLQDDQGWRRYRRTRNTRNARKYNFIGYVSNLPEGTDFATGNCQGNLIEFTGAFTNWHTPSRIPKDITEARAQLPGNAKWAIAQLTVPNHIDHVISSIIQGKAIVVSDGSYKEGFGTSAFVLGTFIDFFLGVNLVPGVPSYHSAHRAELAGIIGGLTLIKLVCQVYNITSGKVTLGLDGQNAMNRAEQDESFGSMADWDLIKVAHFIISELPIDCNWRWIQGHQDDDKSFEELDEWAKMNVVMDTTAKNYWHHCKVVNKQPFKQHLYGEQWSVHWNLRKLSKFHLPLIYSEHQGDITRDFWIDSGHFRKSNIHSPDWNALASPMKQLPFHRRVWLVKHIVGMTGVNRWRYRWKQQQSNQCPICFTDDETTEHVILCKDERVNDQWKNSIAALELQLDKLGTPRTILNTIVQQLLLWRDPNHSVTGEQIQSIIEQQTKVGWKNFLYGRVVPAWQHEHTKLVPSKNGYKSKRWLTQLIRKLWNVAWDLWEHRNGITHSADHPWRIEERNITADKIREQYYLGTTTLLRKDHHRLSRPQEELLALDHDEQTKWLQSVVASRKQYEQSLTRTDDTHSQMVVNMRTNLSNWLSEG